MKKSFLIFSLCMMAAFGSTALPAEAAEETTEVAAEMKADARTDAQAVSSAAEASEEAENAAAADIREKAVTAEEVQENLSELAVSVAADYTEVKGAADEDSRTVGKLYSGNLALVLKRRGNWYKIESGSVTGYVPADSITVGDAEALESAEVQTAVVDADNLHVRSEASQNSEVIGTAVDGHAYAVADGSEDGWIAVIYGGKTGFISADYAEVMTSYSYAETLEEEAERLEEESRTSSGDAVAEFGLQFVGNPYVWGGTSLTDGCDCSGFVMSVYANFGVSLEHSSYAMRSAGYGVSTDDMQAGDIVCYSGHVAIYIGNGQIVHAANSRAGIIVSDVNYMPIVCVRRIF